MWARRIESPRKWLPRGLEMRSDSKINLFEFDALPDGGSKGLTLPAEAGGSECFVVRKGERIFAYINRCPHTGAPLDWSPDQFLDADGSYIICAMHGALFEIETGRCIYGPCVNHSLEPLSVSLAGGMIMLKKNERTASGN